MYDSSCYVFNPYYLLAVRWVKGYRLEVIYDEVFLHVLVQKYVRAAFEELPEHADSHREAKRHHRQIKRRQFNVLACPVQQFNCREPDGREQKSVQRVQHCVPDRELCIEMSQFTQNLRRENKAVYYPLEQCRYLDLECFFKQSRHEEKSKNKKAGYRRLIVVQDNCSDENQNHQQPQN